MNFFEGYNDTKIHIQIQTTSLCTGKYIMWPYVKSGYKQNP